MIMSADLKYIVDAKGEKTPVLVPVKMWNTLNADYNKMQAKLRVFEDIRLSLEEIENAKKTGKSLRKLESILR